MIAVVYRMLRREADSPSVSQGDVGENLRNAVWRQLGGCDPSQTFVEGVQKHLQIPSVRVIVPFVKPVPGIRRAESGSGVLPAGDLRGVRRFRQVPLDWPDVGRDERVHRTAFVAVTGQSRQRVFGDNQLRSLADDVWRGRRAIELFRQLLTVLPMDRE